MRKPSNIGRLVFSLCFRIFYVDYLELAMRLKNSVYNLTVFDCN